MAEPFVDRVVSEGEEWTVVDFMADRRYTYTSYDCPDPEGEARKFYEALTRSGRFHSLQLRRRKIIRLDDELVERYREEEPDGEVRESDQRPDRPVAS